MIDLHAHSAISDGTESPAVVVGHAVAAGLHAFALTDHDTLEHVPAAQAAAVAAGLRFIPGCEISCDAKVPGALHLLVYFVEPGCALDGRLGALQAARETRNAAMVERLAELGMPIELDEVLKVAGDGVVGRPHLATVLIEHGYVTSVQEAFDRYLGQGRPAYVERERLEVREAIAVAHASGGVAVVAHPHSLHLRDPQLDRYLAELAETGLDGLECEYPSYDRAQRDRLLALADRHGLAPTGGSDYHGAIKPGLHVGVGSGDLAVPDVFLLGLEARRPSSGVTPA
jgi:predicted metal-dependent phosphoesterase TrpH